MEHMFYTTDNRIVANENDISEMEDLLWRKKK